MTAVGLRKIRVETLALAVVMLASFGLKLNHLGHAAMTEADESLHATVARNLLLHPLRPTLIDRIYLPDHWWDWAHNQIWLHKPILPLWQIALSYRLLGFGTFALRFPSALLSTLAVGLTYLIGTELLDRKSALIAALLQAFSPALMMEVHGYLFADHVDIALLFWTEVAIYLLVRSIRSGSGWEMALCGVAQGLAFLCKSWLATIVTGLALTIYLAPLLGLTPKGQTALRWRHLLLMLGATIIVAGPWNLYSYLKWPDQFRAENVGYLEHLTTNFEGWGLPWYRLAYDYLFFLYGGFYTAVLVALLVGVWVTITSRNLRKWILIAWALGVLVPHLFASTKTPTMTLLAIPALLLLLGWLITEAVARVRLPLVAAVGIFLMGLLIRPKFRNWPGGYPAAATMADFPDWPAAQWVLWQLAGAACIALALIALFRWLDRTHWRPAPRVRRILNFVSIAIVLGVGLMLTAGLVRDSYRVTQINSSPAGLLPISVFARDSLPGNAVLIFDERYSWEVEEVAYRSFRTCYSFEYFNHRKKFKDFADMGSTIRQAGGEPYLVSYRAQPYPVLRTFPDLGWAIYRLP